MPKSAPIRSIALTLVFSLGLAAQQPSTEAPLDNQRILQLIQSGVRPNEVIRIISTAPSVSFNLLPSSTDAMLKQGVSEEVIRAMAAREIAVAPGVRSAAQSPVVQAAPARHHSHKLRNWILIGLAAGGAAYAGYALSNPSAAPAPVVHF